MINRVWHGWTTLENSDAYQRLVMETVYPQMESLRGYRGAWFLRRELESGEVEFMAVSRWDSLDDIRAFAVDKEDVLRTTVPPEAEKLLARCDSHAIHYEQLLEPGAMSMIALATRVLVTMTGGGW